MKPGLIAVFLAAASPMDAAEFHFCWRGSGGYSLTGSMSVPDSKLTGLVTEADVTKFEIKGFRHNVEIGSWNLTNRSSATTWLLRFDPEQMLFLTGGSFPGVASQGWNADGDVANCGAGGFGFNSGNYSQDICLDGEWIENSMIDPETPFPVGIIPLYPDCETILPLS
jgi:hypothetical protein